MLQTWGSYNRVTSAGLVSQYRTKRETRPGGYSYEYTRIRTKNYAYVGMDLPTARDCVEAMLLKYRRKVFPWVKDAQTGIWSRNINEQMELHVANVQLTHEEGAMWRIDVQVNETAAVYSDVAVPDIAGYVAGMLISGFQSSAAWISGDDWDYDED